jgi:CHAT domain-containing protein
VQGEAATAERFRTEAATADLLHVATHADYRQDAPLLSGLELAGGPLRLVEVLGLRLPASLVVLSACETGLGHLDAARGIVGFHRAFLAAGARRVISSLWRVSDLGTALLMKHFFRRLAAGQPPAAALRRAQNTVRRRFPHPAFWAGFRLDGAP